MPVTMLSAGCDETSAYEVHPKQMPGNPRRDNRAHGLGQCEMFGAEGSKWCRVEDRPKQNEPVKSVRFLPIAAKKNRDQPDCKNRSEDKIRPDHLAGNRYENQSCRRI